MHIYIVNDKSFGTLIPLVQLIDRIGLKDVASWRLRDITLYGRGCPFGMNFNEFEAATRATLNGFEVSDQDFRTFLMLDFQIIDGEVDAWSGTEPAKCILRIDCEDATQWEIATDSLELISKLENAGFQRE